MLHRVQTTKSPSNVGLVSIAALRVKTEYYRLLIHIYRFAGNQARVAMTNSTWTNGHIASLWPQCPRIELVYPPCDLDAFAAIPLARQDRSIQVLSLAQFRPEKDHVMQLQIAKRVLATNPQVQFILVGGCRDDRDEARVASLKRLAQEMDIADSVHFKVNLPFDELIASLTQATIGLHTMVDEHFGIGIVELMAAGLIVAANDSGGPKADIIRPNSKRSCHSPHSSTSPSWPSVSQCR